MRHDDVPLALAPHLLDRRPRAGHRRHHVESDERGHLFGACLLKPLPQQHRGAVDKKIAATQPRRGVKDARDAFRLTEISLDRDHPLIRANSPGARLVERSRRLL